MNKSAATPEPPFANTRPGNEEGPHWDFPWNMLRMSLRVTPELDAMRRRGHPEYQTPWRPWTPRFAQMNRAIPQMLKVFTPENYAYVDPRMRVARPVVVTAHEVVQVDIEPTIAWDHPPPTEIWIGRTTNDEVGFAHYTHDSKSGPDAGECAGTKFRGGTDSPREPGLSADGRRANQPAMDETTSTLLPHDRGQDTVRGGTIGVAVEQGFENPPELVRDHHRRGLPDNCDRPGRAVPAPGMITDEASQAGVSDLFSELVRGYDYDLLGRINFFIAIHGRDERCVSGNTINRKPGDEADLVPGQTYTDAILAQFATFGVQDHSPISVTHRDNPVAGTLQAKSDTPEC